MWFDVFVVATLGIIYNIFHYRVELRREAREYAIRELEKIKTVAVVEDNDSDYVIFEHNFKLRNVIIKRYRFSDNLHVKFNEDKPDFVIADCHLRGKGQAHRVRNAATYAKVQWVLITGLNEEIEGIQKKRMFRRRANKEKIEKLLNWTGNKLGLENEKMV